MWINHTFKKQGKKRVHGEREGEWGWQIFEKKGGGKQYSSGLLSTMYMMVSIEVHLMRFKVWCK